MFDQLVQQFLWSTDRGKLHLHRCVCSVHKGSVSYLGRDSKDRRLLQLCGDLSNRQLCLKFAK